MAAMAAFTILAALFLSSGAAAAAADCGSGAGTCNDETSLVQIKSKVHFGSDQPNEVDSMKKRLSGYAKQELKNLEGKGHMTSSEEASAPRKSEKAQSFIGTVGNRKWYFWFRKASNSTGKLGKPNLAEIAKGGDENQLFSLTPSSDTEGSPSSLQLWGWGGWDDWGPYPMGPGALGGLGDGCPNLGLGIPGCSWADQALGNGYAWNNLALGLPGTVPGYGAWDLPPWRRPFGWSVFAALPADKSSPMELTAKPAEVATVEYDIEKQMKAAKYAVTTPKFKQAATNKQRAVKGSKDLELDSTSGEEEEEEQEVAGDAERRRRTRG